MICTMEMINDEDTPRTIKQALKGEQSELWKKSAIAEVNNFLKRGSWKFVTKEQAWKMKRSKMGIQNKA